MEKRIVKKVYLACDHIFLSKDDAEKMLKLIGMEDKEGITECYALFYDNNDFMDQYEWFDYETNTDLVGVDRNNVECKFFDDKLQALNELRKVGV